MFLQSFRAVAAKLQVEFVAQNYQYLTVYSIDTRTHQQQTAFKKIVGKEEIARNEQFLLFPQFFLLNQKIVSPFRNIYDIISLFAAELEEPTTGIWGKGLIHTRVVQQNYREGQTGLFQYNPENIWFFWEGGLLWFLQLLEWCSIKINPFPNKPWFLRVCRSLLKTLWEKENCS